MIVEKFKKKVCNDHSFDACLTSKLKQDDNKWLNVLQWLNRVHMWALTIAT